MKKSFFIIGIVILLMGLLYSFRYELLGLVWTNKNPIYIGKGLELTVYKDELIDYSVFEKGYELWNTKERKKMAEYMKKNNLRIKEGYYEFNQGTTFENALKIFKFEKIN